MRIRNPILVLMGVLAMTALAVWGCGEPTPRPTAPKVATPNPTPTPTVEPPAPVTGAVKTELVKTNAGWELRRGGKPFIIKGVGGDFDKQRLVAIGGNAYRTWGTPSRADLDEAQKLGLAVCVGIWLNRGPDAIRGAIGEVRRVVNEYKDHPAVLCWGIGNEMEQGNENNPALWEAIESLAAEAKKLDPNHPTMTVIAEMGGQKIQNIHKYCPSIDIVGINSYAGAASIPQRYKQAGGTKPYTLTEYGPPGAWEAKRTAWNASFELTSTEKGDMYRKAWVDGIMAAQGLAVGGYAFLWGNKNETTVSWYGMVMHDDESNLEAVEVLAKEWGKPLANRCPKIKALKVDGETSVAAGTVIKASVEAVDPDGDKLTYQWVLRGDSRDNRYGGGARAEVEALANAITKGNGPNAEVKLPNAGPFRLFVYIHDGKGNGAVGNIPLQGK
jgi:hypothetical protein